MEKSNCRWKSSLSDLECACGIKSYCSFKRYSHGMKPRRNHRRRCNQKSVLSPRTLCDHSPGNGPARNWRNCISWMLLTVCALVTVTALLRELRHGRPSSHRSEGSRRRRSFDRKNHARTENTPKKGTRTEERACRKSCRSLYNTSG